MRRSCAPSANRFKSRAAIANSENEVTSSSDWCAPLEGFPTRVVDPTSSWGSNSNNRNYPQEYVKNKVFFNVVWRDVTTKKHKTWKGDGTLEVQSDGNRAVLKDDQGKYMGCTNSFKLSDLKEGFQMSVGGKEIELQEQIKDVREVFAQRKLQVANRGWGEEEWQPEEPAEKKPKGHFVFQPSLVLPMPPTTKENRQKSMLLKRSEQPSTSGIKANIEPLILPTPIDTPAYKHNKLDRPVHKVCVGSTLVQHLRPHQREGVRFIYDCVMGFKKPPQQGVLLADEMGLGKTLQCLVVAHTLLRQGPYAGERVLQRILIVTPSSLTSTWNNEITKWLSSERMFAFVVDGKHKLQQYSQQQHIPFVVVSYETFVANAEDFQQLEFDLLICDEGHRLKNKATKVYSALRNLPIQRRILLTGTPVQNDLQEFFTLADFVNPGVFGSYSEFRKYYEQPIVQGQCPEANEEVLQLAAERTEELNNKAATFLLRRTQDVNRQYLPKKLEYIVFLKPSELQQLMLQKVLELYERRKETILKNLTPLQIITILKKICNHPSLIARTQSPNLLTRNLERYLPDWSEMGPFDSGKLELVQNFLTCTAVKAGEKVVIVSNHTKTLNMLQGLCDHLDLKCLRLDGSTPAAERNANVQKFNKSAGKDAELVFLISAKAGGMGLNLCGASRLILFDNDWNPATDSQALSRIWRDGQERDVQIYRLVTAGTIEEKIFQRQVAKMSLGSCLTGGTENMKFSDDELADLFTLQTDFSSCQTHDSLNCDCKGDGKNCVELAVGTDRGRQINELMQWKHNGTSFEQDFLESACLLESSESILYIFSQQTQLS